MDNDLLTIAADWLAAKNTERMAAEHRRSLEGAMLEAYSVGADFDGTETIDAGEYIIRITRRTNRKVDADLAQEIAAEHGMIEHLQALFRWKPEVDARAWANADKSITAPLSRAVTATPARPSFTITKLEV